ncbi:hypothetical protein [Propionibacterium australiense]|uniref:hypothetical protein n=1 Tax=Propionibacterium australiense TaxID=119981 RepID=UPI0011C39869|nr:hypothetical protein [Propionibacterium australiense]
MSIAQRPARCRMVLAGAVPGSARPLYRELSDTHIDRKHAGRVAVEPAAALGQGRGMDEED